MELRATQWLVDRSALWRADHDEVGDRLEAFIHSGLARVSIATELEIGYSARSTADYHLMRERVIERLVPVALPSRAEGRARDVQKALVQRGQHRAVSIPDLLIAATAEIENLTVLHYDSDFDLITEVTGQPTEWVVSQGSIP